MAKRTEEVSTSSVPVAGAFSRMLTLDQVEEVLNLGKPLVYALVRSGELRAAQFGGRGVFGESAKMTWPRTSTRRTRRRRSVSPPVRSAKATKSMHPLRTDNGTEKRRRPTPAWVPAFDVFEVRRVNEAWIEGATVRRWMRPLPVWDLRSALLSAGALPLTVPGQAS